MTERVERCDKCRFWRPDRMECRRLSPAPGRHGTMRWGFTEADDWCGEFTRVPFTQAEAALGVYSFGGIDDGATRNGAAK